MANTTNFGWETPDDTDLVKDGAAAMRTLGNAIDTSLVDLKGGTTGQVLTKATNADLDYTWTTPQVGDITEVAVSSPITGGGTSGSVTIGIQDATTAQKGAVQLTNSTSSTSTTTAATPSSVKTAFDLADAAIAKSIVNAKGDLISASANDTPAILTAGANGETLVADSSTTTGLRWQGHIEAGKNFLINGGFDIWQRGTSSTSGGIYGTADRWFQLIESGSGTWAQETTVVPTGSTFSLKFTASSTSSIYPIQAIESINATRLAGKRVVFSGLVAASTSTAMSMVVSHSSSVDVAPAGSWTNLTAVSGGTATPTSTTFVPISGVYDIPSTAKSIRVLIRTTSTIASGVVVYWGNLQLELGSVATEFSRAGGTIAGELQAAQRYLPAIYGATNTMFGYAYSTTGSQIYVKLPVTARVAPTGITVNPTLASNYNLVNQGFTGGTPTSIAFNASGIDFASINITTTAGSPTLVTGQPVQFQTLNNNGYILFTGCEL